VISHSIGNPNSKLKADVVDGDGEKVALAVATRDLKVYENQSLFFINSDEGIDMNKNGGSGGTPDIIHVGISDGVYWTGSNIIGGKANFNSGDRANSGSVSVKVDNPAIGNVWQFNKGSDLSISNYVSISMAVNIDKDWSVGESIIIYAWDTGTSSIVGNSVALEDYLNELDFDVWQIVSIPFTDLGLTSGTFDALRMSMDGTSAGKRPKLYFDDIQVEQTGTPLEYVLEPETGSWLYVENLTVTIVDVYDSSVANGTTQGLPYNTLLGETLSVGISYKREHAGEVLFNTLVTSLIDFMQFPATSVQSGSDGTNTWMTVNVPFNSPLILKPESADKLSFTINDDLTGLLFFRATAGGKKEIRS